MKKNDIWTFHSHFMELTKSQLHDCFSDADAIFQGITSIFESKMRDADPTFYDVCPDTCNILYCDTDANVDACSIWDEACEEHASLHQDDMYII